MAKIHILYRERNIKYSDGKSLEKKMLDYTRNKKVIFNKNEKWPLFYHFSKYREGILSWYPFKDRCTILEIGSGCGAITELLCKKAKRVVSVELEYNRAIINYKRHLKLNNLEIIVGDIKKIEFNEKFDYVILNGVLEYAQYISDCKSDIAYTDFLKRAKSFIKKDGTILLAIENRLGLKYFTGYKEDHLGSVYSGINGYNESNIKTFSKQELTELIESSGCKVSKWYYPWPDYKFTFEIFTDKTINKIYPTMMQMPLDFDQIELINSDHLYRSFMNDNIMQHFANSFLVEINNTSSRDIDYVKLSTLRKEEFSISTTVSYKKGIVCKRSTCNAGSAHIKKISKNRYNNKILTTINYKYKDDCCECNIIEGKTLLDIVLNDSSKLIPTLDMIYDSLKCPKQKTMKPSKDFKKVFGDVQLNMPLNWIKNINIDILLDNLYKSQKKYLIIDPEWQFDFYIPAEYIIWRILFNLPQNGLCNRNKIKKTIKHFNISSDLCDVFIKMEYHFIFDYVGLKELPYKKVKKFNINKLLKKI